MTDGLRKVPAPSNPLPRVAIVDDDRFSLKIAERALAEIGITEQALFEDGEHALRDLNDAGREKRRWADIVMIDINLPNVDGLAIIRHLAEYRFTGSVVLLTGENERVIHTVQLLAQAYKLNVLGILRKPFSREALLALMTRWHPSQQPAVVEDAVRSAPITPEALREAIEGNRLINHYQPKVSLQTASITGFEALVRMKTPQGAIIGPGAFISVAEEHRLIDQLTLSVLRQAIDDCQKWRSSGLNAKVCVNVSMDNLADVSFMNQMFTVLDAGTINSKYLTFEVTESRLMSQGLVQMESLTRLRLRRYGLSIDDFGTGHSTLKQLRDIPFDEIKVDRGFVTGAGNNPGILPLLQASISLGRGLGIATVAEGVETLADWKLLHALRCDQAQGYFIGKPMPAEQIADWATDWNGRMSELTASPH